MATTKNLLIKGRGISRSNYPVAASAHIYQGSLVYVNSGGYADDDTNTGSNKFAGIAIDEVDNSSGANGDKNVEVWQEGEFALPGSSFTQSTVGQDIYGSDNATVTTTSTNNTRIGAAKRFRSATEIYTKLDPTS